jgi:uncharacterized membrane protein YkvA (DUF1232 family)
VRRLKEWARRLVAEVVVLWFCTRHPRTPFIAKAVAVAVVAYAFSPIDLIPDFIPVLGYLDDLLILPIGIWLVLKLVPQDVLAECREQAAHWQNDNQVKPRNYLGAALVIVFWLALLVLGGLWLSQRPDL